MNEWVALGIQEKDIKGQSLQGLIRKNQPNACPVLESLRSKFPVGQIYTGISSTLVTHGKDSLQNQSHRILLKDTYGQSETYILYFNMLAR